MIIQSETPSRTAVAELRDTTRQVYERPTVETLDVGRTQGKFFAGPETSITGS